jgi:hypothetical protein
MELELEKINQVKQLLVDTDSLCTTIDNMYYQKKYDTIEEFSKVKEYDVKFRKCRDLLKLNLNKLTEILDTNFNLVLALQLHLTVMKKEMELVNAIEVEEEQTDDLTVEVEMEKEQNVVKVVKKKPTKTTKVTNSEEN